MSDKNNTSHLDGADAAPRQIVTFIPTTLLETMYQSKEILFVFISIRL